MNYNEALALIRSGALLTRKTWDEKKIFVFLVNGSTFKVNREPLLSILGDGTEVTYRPHIDMRYSDGSIGPWIPTMEDMVISDWWIYEKNSIAY